MGIEEARAWLKTFGADGDIRELSESSATVELAAKALGTEGRRIAKTLSFLVEGKPVLIVAAGDGKVDNKAFKARFHTKAKMLSPEEVENLIGHRIGGVCPFGVKEGVTVYLDESLKRFATVFPACGSANSAIELTLPPLEEYSASAGWVNVCRGWREEEEKEQPTA